MRFAPLSAFLLAASALGAAIPPASQNTAPTRSPADIRADPAAAAPQQQDKRGLVMTRNDTVVVTTTISDKPVTRTTVVPTVATVDLAPMKSFLAALKKEEDAASSTK